MILAVVLLAQTFCHNQDGSCHVTSPIMPCQGVVNSTPCPVTPTPTPRPPTPSPTPVVVAKLGSADVKPLTIPDTPQFYAPAVAKWDAKYHMFTTVGDAIAYSESTLPLGPWAAFSFPIVATKNTWEDDGGNFDGRTTGVSHPAIIKQTSLLIGFTGGPVPNTDTRGGVGFASTVGQGWVHQNSPAARGINGHSYMLGDIGDWVYFSVSNSMSIPPTLYRAKLVAGKLEAWESLPTLQSGSRPLGRAKEGILWAIERGMSAAGPIQVDIALGTETSPGKIIAELRAVDFGKTSIHSLTLTDVSIAGDWYGGMIGIAAWGNQWGNWDPVGIDLTKALKGLTAILEPLPTSGPCNCKMPVYSQTTMEDINGRPLTMTYKVCKDHCIYIHHDNGPWMGKVGVFCSYGDIPDKEYTDSQISLRGCGEPCNVPPHKCSVSGWGIYDVEIWNGSEPRPVIP